MIMTAQSLENRPKVAKLARELFKVIGQEEHDMSNVIAALLTVLCYGLSRVKDDECDAVVKAISDQKSLKEMIQVMKRTIQ